MHIVCSQNLITYLSILYNAMQEKFHLDSVEAQFKKKKKGAFLRPPFDEFIQFNHIRTPIIPIGIPVIGETIVAALWTIICGMGGTVATCC